MSSDLSNSTVTALTIAGSDPSGGAGLQADLKTFSRFGVFGMTVVTGLTAGNTQGVTDAHALRPDFINKQYQSVITDIEPSAVKTGMLFNEEIIRAAADKLANLSCPIVVDPVMVTKRGDILLPKRARAFYADHLLTLADVITPNIPEAELLTQKEINSSGDVEKSAQILVEMGCNAVIIKGGHWKDREHSDDLLFEGNEMIWLRSKRHRTVHTHGAGDAFSAAITALLAKGESIKEAAQKAKRFISRAIEHAPGLGKGQGPVSFFTGP